MRERLRKPEPSREPSRAASARRRASGPTRVEDPARPLVCLCPTCVAADPSRAVLRVRNRLDLLRRLHAADEDEQRDWERLVEEQRPRGGRERERPPRPRRSCCRPTTGREPVRKGAMLNMIDDEGREQFEAYEQTLERIAEYTGGDLDSETLPRDDYREIVTSFGDTHDTI